MKEYDEFKSFIKIPEGEEGQRCFYTLRIDSYGRGCNHNCSYCYAKSLLDFRKLWNVENPAVTDMKRVEKIFSDVFEKDKKSKWSEILLNKIPVRLGGMTDPMQDLEAETETTYKLLQILKKYEYPYLLLTKNARIGEEKYIEVLDKDLAYVQITVTTLNEKYAKKVEQNASSPEDRLKAIKALSDNGIYVAGRLSPLFPMYADGHFTKGVESKSLDFFSWDLPTEICKHGAKTVIGEFLRYTPFIHNWLNHDFGDDMKWVLNENSISRGGAKHFSTEEKKYYFEEVKRICDSFGVDFTVCDDGDFEAFKYLWANQDDCCNGYGKIPGFSTTMKTIR